MTLQRQLFRNLALGLLAGLAVAAVEVALADLLTGVAVPLRPAYALVYLGAGALAGLLVTAAAPASGPATAAAACVALLFLPSMVERASFAAAGRGPAAALLAAVAVIAACLLWVMMLRRVLRERAWGWPLVLGGITAALGLAVNRHLEAEPLSVGALAADVAVVGAVMLLALTLRFAGVAIGLALGAAAAVVVLTGPADRHPPSAASPTGNARNLVLVIVDTLRHDVFENVVEQTAEGARLRAELADAVWYDEAVAASPWTAPSVGSIMTGLYPEQHGYGRPSGDPSRPLRRLASGAPTVAEQLRAHGYHTLAVGTNTMLHQGSGIDRGFEHYEVLQGGSDRLPLLTAAARVGALRPELYQTARTVRRRLEDVAPRLRRDGRPFFLYLHLMDPHFPYHRHRGLSPDPAGEGLRGDERAYREEVRYTAHELAQMLWTLRSWVDWQQTAVVVVGDHGEMFASDGHGVSVTGAGGNPWLRGHGHALYEELVHVPLIIRPAGGDGGGRRVDSLVSHVDLSRAFGCLLGLELQAPAHHGCDLTAETTGEMGAGIPGGRSYAFSGAVQLGPPRLSLRSRRLKLIRHLDGERATEVYDLVEDPLERNVLGLDHPGARAAAEALTEHLEELGEAVETAPVELDRATRERLEALGYLDDGGGR